MSGHAVAHVQGGEADEDDSVVGVEVKFKCAGNVSYLDDVIPRRPVRFPQRSSRTQCVRLGIRLVVVLLR